MPRRQREPGPGCPGWLYRKFANQYSNPIRPARCPCLWSDFIIQQNFKSMMSNDRDLAATIVTLHALFP